MLEHIYPINNYVSLSSGTRSKSTKTIYRDEHKEVRVKFQSFGSNYANAIQFINADTNHKLLQWYNWDNNFYIHSSDTIYTKSNTNHNPILSDIMEIRFNFDSKLLSFYVNGEPTYSQIRNDVIFSEKIYVTVFDGSYSTTPTKLLPE